MKYSHEMQFLILNLMSWEPFPNAGSNISNLTFALLMG